MKVIMVSSVAQHTSTRYGMYTYPVWAEVLGWGIALVSVVWIPVGAIHEICHLKGSFLQVRTGLKCDGKGGGIFLCEGNLILHLWIWP